MAEHLHGVGHRQRGAGEADREAVGVQIQQRRGFRDPRPPLVQADLSPGDAQAVAREEVLHQAQKTAEISHNHPEGIKGAQATALAVFLARAGHDKHKIPKRTKLRFGYDLDRGVDDIRPGYAFDVSCQGTVPEAIIAFLDSASYADAVRNAVSLGGDSDTLACITGGIAEAFYGEVPFQIRKKVKEILTPDLWEITAKFCREKM